MERRRRQPPEVYVLEVNPRGSRTVPFLSKVTGVPMVKAAVKAMLGRSLVEQGYQPGLYKRRKLVGVKAPVSRCRSLPASIPTSAPK